MGFQALATTSAGFAGTMGRLDGRVTRHEALEHARTLVAATELPVSADLENCFAHDPGGVAETIGLAVAAGLAGASVEDHSPGTPEAIYAPGPARHRVEAAADAAHTGPVRIVRPLSAWPGYRSDRISPGWPRRPWRPPPGSSWTGPSPG